MSIATKYTVAEYLEFERNSPLRHEFFEGEIFEMVGGTLNHVRIIVKLCAALLAQLHEPEFFVLTNDMRIKVDENGLHTYPDVVVVKGEPELEDDCQDTLLNPIVLMEVLSKSTERYDRTKKFLLYQAIPCLMEYVLVAQYRPEVDQYVRSTAGSWQHFNYQNLSETLVLQSVPCSIPLSAIYQNIKFVPNA
jgi:Uma2 family endonuclease